MCCSFVFSDTVPMYKWAIFLFCLLGAHCETSSESEAYYECGSHGRFEYCIDGIPGCVIGCHCHPGYYFDTATKICEPNIRLTQDYRRHYALEPTRLPMVTLAPTPEPTPTTKNPIDAKVDAIAKDSDDLGDWLYNQFFKTIENQVINSTDDDKITRRSGSQVAKPIPRNLRRSRKRRKNKSKRKRYKKKGLKRKLLRITEDDSLFDSSSGSSSGEVSSSSESDSDTSVEEDDDSHSTDKEHGHRKILMVNKKKKPPLPSFIFLPNVETPFYPPIGLPPPPIVPMYPMIPVPPVVGFLPNCSSSETTSTTTTTMTTSKAEETTVASTTVDTSTATNVETEQPAEPVENQNIRKALKSNKHGLRNRMMKKRQKSPSQNFLDNYQDLETTYSGDLAPPQFRSRDLYNQIPPVDDVDFKYLSQLIHKMDLNKTKPGTSFKPKQRMADLPNRPFRRNYISTPPSHYNLVQKLRPASKADDINDSYYSNLGRQIASLIRKVDSDGERQIDIEIQQQNDPMQTIFNENRYSPRSYWERFVRSPLKLKQNFLDQMNYLKNSNENLFNLEDRVRMAAAVERSLSLHELENIANVMERTQSISRRKSSKNVTPSSSSRSYNINLLPTRNKRVNTAARGTNKIGVKSKTIEDNKSNRNMLSTLHYNIYPTHNEKNITQPNKSSRVNKKQGMLKNMMQTSRNKPVRLRISRIIPMNITTPRMISARQMMAYHVNPMMMNYKTVKYIGSNNNQYQLQPSFAPFQMPLFSKPVVTSVGRKRSSYFHHELDQFDYFE